MSYRTNRRTRNIFRIRRPEKVAEEAIEGRIITAATSKFLPREQQKLVEEELRRRAYVKIHEEQDTLDVSLHRNETIAGEERQQEIFFRSYPQLRDNPNDTEEQFKARRVKQFYEFERWKARNLFKQISEFYGFPVGIPDEFYRVIESNLDLEKEDTATTLENEQKAVNILASIYDVPAPKVVRGNSPLSLKDPPDKRPYGEYVAGDNPTIYFTYPTYSPYVVAHEFYHHLIAVSPKVVEASLTAQKFLGRL